MIVAAIVGSMIGVTINLLASDRIANRLRRRADAKGTTSRVDRVSGRAGPILDRLGPVGLGLVGPIVLGTFGTALVGPLKYSTSHQSGRPSSSVSRSGCVQQVEAIFFP